MREKIKTGIKGLDTILHGGFPKGNVVMVEGAPGTGKTTLGIQYLIYGASQNQPGLYISFEETPQQIFSNMTNFQSELNEYEQRSLLKIISFSPKALMEDMLNPGGVFEELILSFSCQRIVIDSLSLIKYLSDGENNVRELIYTFRNTLRKYGLTAVIINEEIYTNINSHSMENFVVDGIIQLYFDFANNHARTLLLEVVKMRGTNILEDQHIYRITDEGIHIIPAYISSDFKRKSGGNPKDLIPTGIKKLDEILSGGVSRGEIFLIETDSLTTVYKYILALISSERLKQGEKFFYSLSSSTTIEDFISILKRFKIDLVAALQRGEGYFLEHYRRPILEGIEERVLDATNFLSEDEYWTFINEKIIKKIKEDFDKRTYWFTSYNINTALDKHGKEFINTIHGELLAIEKSMAVTVFMHCNIEMIDTETRAMLENKCDGVIKLWSDTKYQYLQVIKSPISVTSRPFVIETTDHYPFIKLL
ncbi:ATPase domain-containing protein [Bacillus suaedae]|uniref:KaiC domain-containing protein n=1 Tax=Halalkalibacter suaedae TaxID=2822140 RepID=A0A940WWZ6_9BACI|nr:ATPase domain-containing protein [Bacillus suaedae]MBP3953228.1 hypothetical protein [Bacillus suaedae]